MNVDFLGIVELGGFAWGVYTWVVSRRDKQALEQRKTITDQIESQSKSFAEKFTDHKTDISELKRAVNELQKQMAAIQVQMDDVKTVSKMTGTTALESAHLIELSVGSLKESVDKFGRVIVKQ